MACVIEVNDLIFTYPRAHRPAVRGISFRIERGQIFGFLGPSGAGKSTVQNLMIGLLPTQKGSILYDGKTLSDMGKSFFNRVGVSFEHPNLYEKLTGIENLRYYGGLFDRPVIPPEQLLDMVGLGEAKNKRAGAYSKGMKQRLVFARAIMNRPDILFLDEPTSGLDPGTAQRIKEIILKERDRGATIFLTTHNMFAADELCDEVAFINEGQLVAQDSPRNLKLKYGQKAIKVEYRSNGQIKSEILFVERDEDRHRLGQLLDTGTVETLHSQEATLEQVFVKLTGRGLS
ncbi:MAG: ABC transporter ATP-binding protein [Bacillota bacterium]